MIEWFDLDAIGRSAARFDFVKLENLNGHYLRETPDAEIVRGSRRSCPSCPTAPRSPRGSAPKAGRRSSAAMPGLKERAKTLVELLDNAAFLFAKRPLALDEQAAKLLDAAGPRRRSRELLPRLEAVEPWTMKELEASVRSFADETGRKLGKVAQPLRAALTGKSTSPGIFDVLEVLGRGEVACAFA